MRTIAICLLLAGLLTVTLGGCGKSEEPTPDTPGAKPAGGPDMKTTGAACIREEGKKGRTIGCPDCDVGYVKGEKTSCKNCYAAARGGPACQTRSKRERRARRAGPG